MNYRYPSAIPERKPAADKAAGATGSGSAGLLRLPYLPVNVEPAADKGGSLISSRAPETILSFWESPNHGPVWTWGRVAGARGRKPEGQISGDVKGFPQHADGSKTADGVTRSQFHDHGGKHEEHLTRPKNVSNDFEQIDQLLSAVQAEPSRGGCSPDQIQEFGSRRSGSDNHTYAPGPIAGLTDGNYRNSDWIAGSGVTAPLHRRTTCAKHSGVPSSVYQMRCVGRRGFCEISSGSRETCIRESLPCGHRSPDLIQNFAPTTGASFGMRADLRPRSSGRAWEPRSSGASLMGPAAAPVSSLRLRREWPHRESGLCRRRFYSSENQSAISPDRPDERRVPLSREAEASS